MKIFGLVFVLMLIHCCTAATNRSTVWFLVDGQLYTTNGGYQTCQISSLAATDAATLTTYPTSGSINLLTTNNLNVAGTFAGTATENAAANKITTLANPLLYTVILTFSYNSTYYVTLTLAAPTTSTVLSVANILDMPLTGISLTSSTSINANPLVIGANSISTSSGLLWLTFQNIPAIYSKYAGGTSNGISGIVITDYISSSTIVITTYVDNNNAAAGANVGYANKFYQLGIRTKTSSISSTSTMLTSGSTCTTLAAGRKRSVDHFLHLISKRAAPTSCTGLTSIEPSLSSTTLSSICTSVGTVTSTTVGTATSAALSGTDLTGSLLSGVYAMNALYETDYLVFGAAGSKFTIATNFGILISISSIIFRYLN